VENSNLKKIFPLPGSGKHLNPKNF